MSTLACYKIFSQKINSINARLEVRKGARKISFADGIQFIFVQEFGK